jgi:transposase
MDGVCGRLRAMGATPTHVRKPYPSDLTDEEWALIAPYVPHARPGGHPEEHPKREILNGIFYVVRSGCA